MTYRQCIALVVSVPLLAACSSGVMSSTTPATSPATASVETSGPGVASVQAAGKATLLPAVAASLAALEAGTDAIPADRKTELEKVATFVRSKLAAGDTARLVFICTHNSRRSQMGQIWAAAAAAYYGVDHVEMFSGGLEVTAFNSRAIAAVQRSGFQIASPAGENPHVKVTYASDRAPLEMFSKKYDDAFNPKDNFAAVMTCSHADAACPLVIGASARIPVHYEDPKESDGSPAETATYDARSKQIATEMLFVFSRVKQAPAGNRISGL